MRRVIFNQKGGVGKSTITCNLAAISAQLGFNTLVIDLDPQANTSQYVLGNKSTQMNTTIVDFFQDMLNLSLRKKELQQFIQTSPFNHLDILPSHPDLAELETKLESRYKIYKLRDALKKLTQYDFIYIDTPPALGFYTLCALIAADTCLIPFDCDEFSRRSLYHLIGNITEIQQDHNNNLRIEGIIVNQYESRAIQSKKIVKELIDDGLPVMDVYLSHSIKIRESHEKSQPMIHLDPNHKLSLEFKALYEKLHQPHGKK
ncbi:MAG: ParA family protein [Desulfobacterales bacterium]|nr:ParA family protein [Desulfobacterales bacterium]